jgi:hypothetical protein
VIAAASCAASYWEDQRPVVQAVLDRDAAGGLRQRGRADVHGDSAASDDGEDDGHGCSFAWRGIPLQRPRRSNARDRWAVKEAPSGARVARAEGPTLTARRCARTCCRRRGRATPCCGQAVPHAPTRDPRRLLRAECRGPSRLASSGSCPRKRHSNVRSGGSADGRRIALRPQLANEADRRLSPLQHPCPVSDAQL